MTPAILNVREPESEEKPQKSLNEKQQVDDLWHACKTTIFINFLIK